GFSLLEKPQGRILARRRQLLHLLGELLVLLERALDRFAIGFYGCLQSNGNPFLFLELLEGLLEELKGTKGLQSARSLLGKATHRLHGAIDGRLQLLLVAGQSDD